MGTLEAEKAAKEKQKQRLDRLLLAPVGWMLGPDLVAQLRKILRHRSDPRDWMPSLAGGVHDECGGRGQIVTVTADPTKTAERVADPQGPHAVAAPPSDCWFDYVADCGDASEAMYAIAYATYVRLRPDQPPGTATWTSAPQHIVCRPVTVDDPEIDLERERTSDVCDLPPGEFLFVGGDTAYHVADAATLRARVQTPFQWAFADACDERHVADPGPNVRPRRIYGIPGNHDWYDNLEGFSLVYRRGDAVQVPRPPRKQFSLVVSMDCEGADQPIELPLYERVQHTSYPAIRLPQGWQLWGLDVDTPLDAGQFAYFRSLPPPKRVIVATPSPAIALGVRHPKPDHRDALRALGLALPFDTERPKDPATHRLDLSGDVHQYARYAPRSDDAVPATYGSVVSGLGGAFHHPSFTRLYAKDKDDRVSPERQYPTDKRSRICIAKGMLRFGAMWQGSWIRLLPLLFGLILGFASTQSKGGRWLLDRVFELLPRSRGETVPSCSSHDFWNAAAFLGAIVVAGFVLWGAIQLGRYIYREQAQHPELAQRLVDYWRTSKANDEPFPTRVLGAARRALRLRRAYGWPWFLGILAITLLAVYPRIMTMPDAPFLDVASVLVACVIPVALTIVAVVYGAKGLRIREKIAVGIVGLVHAVVQVVVPLVFARLFTASWMAVIAGLVAVVVATASPHAARWLFEQESRLAVVAIAIVAAATVVVVTGALVYVADGELATSAASSWQSQTWRYLVSGLCCMFLGTVWVTWYLAICARLNAHNNEVGGAARVSRYRQFIRFHVHADGLTGYVISIQTRNAEKPASKGGALSFRVIDVFTIET